MVYDGVAAFSVMFPLMTIEIEESHEVSPLQTASFCIMGLVAVVIRPQPAGVGYLGIGGEGEPITLHNLFNRNYVP